ncbi:unnamed protein product [Adineta ricciae]|uniref:NHL repeat containing protein-like protein n=1 Tax=Adineta ricciae TaxID=249248 RepID=A0A815NFR0_ADIRI|nr:unnamed protein product [Adineta ricciae]
MHIQSRINCMPSDQHLSRKNSRSDNFIHVNIRSPIRRKITNSKSVTLHGRSRSAPKVIEQLYEKQNNEINISSKTNVEDDNLRNDSTKSKIPQKKKYKCTRKCAIGSLLILSIFVIITVSILIILLLSRKATRTRSVAVPILRWNTTGITVAGISRVLGNSSDQLNRPLHVILDYLNTLYIADSDNNRVQKYLKNATNGTTVAGNSTAGSYPNQLDDPSSLLVDETGDLFVADSLNNRIQFWPFLSMSGTTVAGNSSGFPGNTNNTLFNPYDVVRDSKTGTLYITDFSNHRIMSHASGASSGNIVAGGNGAGLNNTQLNYPIRCYLDSALTSFIIINMDNNNIDRSTSTLFRTPRALTLDPMGNLYVADRDNHRIQFFLNGQSNGTTIAGITGISGNNTNLLSKSRSVILDSQLNLYNRHR